MEPRPVPVGWCLVRRDTNHMRSARVPALALLPDGGSGEMEADDADVRPSGGRRASGGDGWYDWRLLGVRVHWPVAMDRRLFIDQPQRDGLDRCEDRTEGRSDIQRYNGTKSLRGKEVLEKLYQGTRMSISTSRRQATERSEWSIAKEANRWLESCYVLSR